jgi:hypothetical protein
MPDSLLQIAQRSSQLALGSDCRVSSKAGISPASVKTTGGFGQWVMIRGQSVANPPLILLRGGPGLSETGLFRQTKASLCSAARSEAATATCALVVDADDEATIRARLSEDPWPEDLLTVESIRPWLVWLRGSPGS